MSDESLALRIQRLPNGRSRLLVIAQVCGFQNGDGWFDASDARRAFETLRLQAPTNLSRDIGQLAKSGLLVFRVKAPQWSLQPEGREKVKELIGKMSMDHPDLDPSPSYGADFGNARHLLVPPGFAPAKWQPAIQKMLGEFEFERNVFCMTRFPSGDDDPVAKAIGTAREVLDAYGLVLHLASDQQLDDELYANITAHMWACRYGIAIVEDLAVPKRGLNKNLLIEVGAMLSLGRRTALFKDDSIDELPSDLVGHIYKSVELQKPSKVAAAVDSWVKKDLKL